MSLNEQLKQAIDKRFAMSYTAQDVVTISEALAHLSELVDDVVAPDF